MRLKIATLRRVVKGDLAIQFVPQALTSYGGLELLRGYLRQIDFGVRYTELQSAAAARAPRPGVAGLPSDYGSRRLALVLLTLFYAGTRRLSTCAS